MSRDHDLSDQAFLNRLLREGLLQQLSSPGFYARGVEFERVISGFGSLIGTSAAPHTPVRYFFPPVIPEHVAQAAGTIDSFGPLIGIVGHYAPVADVPHCADQEPADSSSRVTLIPSSKVLVSAACHPLYPLLTGTLPSDHYIADILGYCFRNEPSTDVFRMLAFRQQELVCLGNSDDVARQFISWQSVALDLIRGLGLPAEIRPAADAFFGRPGQLLADAQLQSSSKMEIGFDLSPKGGRTWIALASINYHGEHFGRAFDIRCMAGDVASSTCMGFGLERIALALFFFLGTVPSEWPVTLQRRLGL